MLAALCLAAATAPAAHAGNPHSFLIPSETGPVHYPACTGPITWSLHAAGIQKSGSTHQQETTMWQRIFAEIDATTDYTFVEQPPDSVATIRIHYTDEPAQLGLSVNALAQGTAGLAGVPALGWSGTHWVAEASVVVMNPTDLRRWRNVSGLRSWVARHELGHALGLGHQDDPTSTMARTFSRLLSQPAYQARDFEQLNTLARISCPKPLP